MISYIKKEFDMSIARHEAVSHTHSSANKLSKEQITVEMQQIKTRLSQQFILEPEKRDLLLITLEKLSELELGRFLIKNKGALSGYWTWYIILGFNNHSVSSPLEKFMLEKAPVILATRERFFIFQTLLEKQIKSNNIVCSIPCGMMADLLNLDVPADVKDIHFVGIDLDETAFQLAKDLAQATQQRASCAFFKKDAWNLGIHNEYDIITPNGLNIYEPNDSRVVALYQSFFNALKNNGTLICSALSTPPGGESESEWDFSKINYNNLQEGGTLFKVILEATWANFRSTEKTCSQLKEAGFKEIEIHWDSQKIFPTFIAKKKLNS